MNEPARQPAFQPAPGYTTNPDVKEGEVAVSMGKSPRDIALEQIETKTDEMHMAQIKEDTEGDPGAKALHDRMQKAQEKATAKGIADGKLPVPEVQEELDPDGALSRQAMHPELPDPSVPVEPAVLPTELKDDQLAEHIIMDEGQPMFTLKVNGQNVLMPLAEARRRLQIGTAAEIRMQNAASKEKDVNERERKLTAGESALAQRMRVPTVPAQTAPVKSGLNEQDIRKQANDFVVTAFSGSEEDAAEKLTNLLLTTRIPQAMPAAPVDEAAIISRATHAAVDVMGAVERKKDLASGFKEFSKEYPEILADANLYRMADSMTDGIDAEHPEWSKAQVILEAGKRTSEWVENLKGTEPIVEPSDGDVPVTDVSISEQPLPPTQIRQERKQELVRIPQAVTATQPMAEPEEVPQTPQEALNDVRRERGQAV